MTTNRVSNGLFKVLIGSTRVFFEGNTFIKIYETSYISNGLCKVLFGSAKLLFDTKIITKIYDNKSR